MPADPAEIRLLVLDVDGVLTDGRITLDAFGRELKTFDVRDGHGIRVWIKAGYDVAIITGRKSQALAHRARELGVRFVYQGSRDKAGDLDRVLTQTGIEARQAAMVGDDLPDLSVMAKVGYPVAVADASEETKQRAVFVTSAPGGRGAVREVVKHLLSAKGEWDQVVKRAAGEA